MNGVGLWGVGLEGTDGVGFIVRGLMVWTAWGVMVWGGEMQCCSFLNCGGTHVLRHL